MVTNHLIRYKVGHFLTYWGNVRDIANLAHDVGQDGTWWTNESTNYCHEVIVEHKPFGTKSPAWVAVEHSDDDRHVSTCEHSAANCNQSLFTSLITATNKRTYKDWKSYITFKTATCFNIMVPSSGNPKQKGLRVATQHNTLDITLIKCQNYKITKWLTSELTADEAVGDRVQGYI